MTTAEHIAAAKAEAEKAIEAYQLALNAALDAFRRRLNLGMMQEAGEIAVKGAAAASRAAKLVQEKIKKAQEAVISQMLNAAKTIRSSM